MSFNLNTRVNNLALQVAQITASSVENPLVNNLDCNNKNIINCGTLSSTSGLPMNINSPNSYTYFNNQAIFNDTLTINNNTANNGLVVKDQNVDTSCFVVDMSGNVGVKVNPSTPMTTDFTVNGNALIIGDLSANNITGSNIVNSITAGTGLVKSGSTNIPTLSLSNVGTAGTYNNPTSIVTDATGRVSSVSTGSAPVTSVTAGSGISVSGTSTAPVINNTGVNSLTAGSGISVSGTSTAPVINNTGVNSLTAGSGISVGGTSTAPIINNIGINALTAGNGISITGISTAPTINNTGVNSVTAGGGISITGTSTNPIINATATVPNLNQVLTIGNDASGQTINNVGLLNYYLPSYPATPTPLTGVNSTVGTWGGLVNTFLGSTGVGLKNVTYLSGLSALTPYQNKPAVSIVPENNSVGIWKYEPTVGYALDISGNTLVEGELDVSGNVDISGGLITYGNSTFKNNLNILGTLSAPNIVNSITANAPLTASSSSGSVTLGLNQTIINRSVQTYANQFAFPNDGTTVTPLGFTLPSWWNPSNSIMRIKLCFFEPAGQAWTGALGGLTTSLRYYPSGPFAPSFVWSFWNCVKPSGATTLKIEIDNIQFVGTPQNGQNNQIEFTNFTANPSISTYLTCQFEFIQFSTPPVLQYADYWSGMNASSGSYMITDYTVGYYNSS